MSEPVRHYETASIKHSRKLTQNPIIRRELIRPSQENRFIVNRKDFDKLRKS